MSLVPKTPAWIEFLRLYKKLESLWSPERRDWNRNAQKAKDWEILLEKYKEIDPNANLASVKTKINNLRSCFRRELNQIAKRYNYTPNLWYFSELEFLRQRWTKQHHKQEVENEEPPAKIMKQSYSDDGYSPVRSPESSLSPNQIMDDDEQEINFTTLNPLSNVPQKEKNTNIRDDADIFAENWATQFRKLNAKQKIFAKKAIEDIFFLGQLQFLSTDTVQMPQDLNE